MHRGRSARRISAWAAAVTVLAVVGAFTIGGPRVRGAVSSELGRHVVGSGTITDSPAPDSTTEITVDAYLFADGSISGTYTKTVDGVVTSGTVGCMFVMGNGAAVGLGDGWPDRRLITIIDNGASGDTLWVDVDNFYGGDCTAGPIPGTVLATGNFEISELPVASEEPPSATPRPTPEPTWNPQESWNPEESPTPPPTSTLPPDADPNGDGIPENLQYGLPFGSFEDSSLAVATYGSIVQTNGLSVTISDAPYPHGVDVVVGSEVPGAQAELSVCGFTISIDAGSTARATCASVILAVSAGGATISLGGAASLAVPAGATAEVSAAADGSFTVANLGDGTGPDPVLTVDGTTSQVSHGEAITAQSWDFVGFVAPVDNLPTPNRMKAGRAVPLRWSLFRADGTPVLDLTNASLSSSKFECANGGIVDQIEEVASGSSSLMNLGGGRYQINWKSSAAYAGTCRTLHLDIGDGVVHDAMFHFTK